MLAMELDHTDTLEAIEREGMGDFVRACPAPLARELGVTMQEVDGVECFAVRARPRSIMWNHAQGFAEWSPASESVLDNVVNFYREQKTIGAICLTPRASSEETMRMLDAHGYEAGYAYRKFVRGTAPAPNAGSPLEVRPARPQDAHAFAEIVTTAFETPESFVPWIAALVGRPRWHCFMAWDGDRPAGAGALFVHNGAGYCTFGATHPDARRKGAQRALLAHRIDAGLRLGCTTFVTETGETADGVPEQSYRNILWAGFERSYIRDNWVPKA